MMFSLSKASMSKLHGVHPDLVKVVKRAIELTTVDFRVTCGVRTFAEQKALYAQGRTAPGKIVTNTMNSMHLIQHSGYSHAVDVVALVGNKVSWNWPDYEKIADAMFAAAKELNVPIKWGGYFKKPKDGPHFELDRSVYK